MLKKRLLLVATTPGPAKSICDAIALARKQFDVCLISSSDPSEGQGIKTFQNAGFSALAIEGLVQNYIPLNCPDEIADKVLQDVNPDIVLCGTIRDTTGVARPLEDVMFSQAEKKNIPCMQFVEGWDVWYPRKWAFKKPRRLLVIDDLAKQMVVSVGARAESVEVVGYSSSLFRDHTIIPKIREEVRNKILKPSHSRLIVYLGQVTPDAPKTLSWVDSACNANDAIVYQRHPRDQRGTDELFRHCRHANVIESLLDTDTILHGADYCVSHYSLSSFSAAYLGIPTILTLLPEDTPGVRATLGAYPTTIMGGTFEAHDKQAFAATLASIKPAPMEFRQRVRSSAEKSAEKIVAALRRA